MADPKRSVAPRAAKAGPRGRKKRSLWLRVPLWILASLVVVGVVGAGAVAWAYSTVTLPDPNSDFSTNTTFVYYNDGKSKIGSFQVQNRQTIGYDEMPQDVKDAIVAAENRTFWTDPGISVTGLFRAGLGLVGLAPTDVTAAGGGSTLTQQYIKIMYLSQEKTFSRKAKELLFAAKMGQELTKQQLLEGYLNTVYFGRGAYGIEAAARAYFKVPARKLDLPQSVALTAIVNSPGNLDPANGDKEAADLLERYQYTLNGMVEMDAITASERTEIYAELPEFPKVARDSRLGGPKGFLLGMVERELLANGFTEGEINGGGLKVVTTFDADAQDAAVATAQKMTRAAAGSNKAAKQLHAGLASIDNATGGVIALYGGPDFLESQLNWATLSSPVGSTFKPYALAAGLRDGWTLNDKLNGNTLDLPGTTRQVRNAGGGNYGRVTLLTATTKSINTAYVDLTLQLSGGPESVLEAANDAGAPTVEGWDPVSTVALGTPEVSPLYQAAGYSTFANNGVQRDPHVIAAVTDATSNQLYAADTTGVQGIEEDVAIDVTYALSKVAQDGTGYRASQLGYPVAGKTGTAYNSLTGKTSAAWFVGFTRQITTAVAYTRGDGTADLGNSFYGSGYPALTWLEYMRTAVDGLEKESFDPPTKRVSTQTPTAKPTKSVTASPTASATDGATATTDPTGTATATATGTATATATGTATATATGTATGPPGPTGSATRGP